MSSTSLNTASDKRGHTSSQSPGKPLLLSLPPEILQLVLGVLEHDDLHALLSSSKATAQRVMQHRTGKFELKVPARCGRDYAATRNLLQWARPACMKLKIRGGKWSSNDQPQLEVCCDLALRGLIGPTCTAAQQQFLCLTEVCLKGFDLPWLIPPGLPDTCPNVHTLHLHGCEITINIIISSSSSFLEGRALCIAPNITCLSTSGTRVPQLDGLGVGISSGHGCKRLAQAVSAQLRASLPNLSCFKAGHVLSDAQAMAVWGSQLTELHSPEHGLGPRLADWVIREHVQQVRKLVLPSFTVKYARQWQFLLELPQLTHLEVSSFSREDRKEDKPAKDYSSHACTWQYLQLHLRRIRRHPYQRQHLLDLALVPLHSLTHPLVLGSKSGWLNQVGLPDPSNPQHLSTLQRLGNQLMKCGVRLYNDEISYEPPTDLETELSDAQLATLLRALGPAFSSAQHVRLGDITLGLQAVQALGLAHQHHLKQLELETHALEDCTPAFWDTLLSNLPALSHLELCTRVDLAEGEEGSLDKVAWAIRNLASAMAGLNTVRKVDIGFWTISPLELVINVMHAVQPVPAGVEVTLRHENMTDLTDSVTVVVTVTRSRV